MKNRLPFISVPDQKSVCIICEGSEEFDYLERLNQLGVWDPSYKIIPVNADGNGNIPARYQDRYQNASDDVVLIFCDTEKKPYKQYEEIKEKVSAFHGIENASEQVIIFTNPCALQIVLLHWMKVNLKTAAKKVNAPYVEKCTGVKNYKAKKEQREQVYACVNAENFKDMLQRVEELSTCETEVSSTNFRRYADYLLSKDSSWIYSIEENLEEC